MKQDARRRCVFKVRATNKINYRLVAGYKYSYERIKVVFNLATITVIHIASFSENLPPCPHSTG